MTPTSLAFATELAAHPRWTPSLPLDGARLHEPWTEEWARADVTTIARWRAHACDNPSVRTALARMFPDTDDPATVGCLAAIGRLLWSAGSFAFPRPGITETVVWQIVVPSQTAPVGIGGMHPITVGESEGDAWARAIRKGWARLDRQDERARVDVVGVARIGAPGLRLLDGGARE